MAQTLGSVAVGSIVKINENGSPVDFYVAKHDYESGLNGAGRTLVVRKDCYVRRQFDTNVPADYANGNLDTLLNTTYKNLLDEDISSEIGTTKFYYTTPWPDYTVSTLERSVFELSLTELGLSNSYANAEGTALPIASTLQIALLDGSTFSQWTRTLDNSGGGSNVWLVNGAGAAQMINANTQNSAARPAFTLPSTMLVLDNGTIIAEVPPPSALNIPSLIMQGNPISISWSAVDGADGYILERNADNGGWTQVYSGANTSYEDTAGTWTTVQYRVKAGVDGTYGDYTTSAVISVVSASALVISGSDGDLGTLLNDVSYVVASDGTNALTVVETINGTETRTYTATNGATNKIPVVDLPTGYGTIAIKASTTATGGEVSVTREWTYTKAAITFPDAGSVADLTQQGKTIWAKTIAEAVRAPGIWGGNLGLALQKLAGAVLYNPNQVEKYTEVKVSLSGKNEGDIISLPENGQMVEFYMAKLDYESRLNGAGRVLFVRKNLYDSRVWDAGSVNALASSDIDTWMNGDYKGLFSEDIQTAMGTTKFYYTPGNGNTTVGTLERSVFPLSMTELGESHTYASVEGSALPIASELKIAALNGQANAQWTRTPFNSGKNAVWYLRNDGSTTTTDCGNVEGSRPCFTLPSTFTATYYVGSDGTVHDEQEYEEAGSFADIFGDAVPVPRIETGSYTGTGTYGTSNPTSLTFGFEPFLLMISGLSNQNTDGPFIAMNPGQGICIPRGAEGTAIMTWQGETVSWYNTRNDAYQMNDAGRTYNYVAIGLGGESA